MDKLNLPSKIQKGTTQPLSRMQVVVIYNGLKSPKLDEIKNKSLMYAITRSVDKLEPVVKAMEINKVVSGYDEYSEKLRALNERMSGGKTVEMHSGERVWDLNYNSNEYIGAVKQLQQEYGIDQYDKWINGAFDEPIEDYLHFVNKNEVSVENDVPNLGVYKLIKVLFKD